MDIVSRLISERISPEAVRPFWSEVVVHAAGGLVSLLALGALELALPRIAHVLIWTLFLPAVTLIFARSVLRPPIRQYLGLDRDAAPWWFKFGYIGAAPDFARSILPAWQFSPSRLYLPGIANHLGNALGVFAVLMTHWGLWHRFEGLIQLFPVLVIVTTVLLFFLIAHTMTFMRLPEPGKSRWSFW
ncbi:hypothetical protein [Maricaulis sp.]|uniref:hypothetical protein n=1 Tax=Maricaulis sp. TaxID=1486257 RepID=UPI003296AAB4